MGLGLQINDSLYNHSKSGELLLEQLGEVDALLFACIRVVAIARQERPWALFYGEVVVSPEAAPGPNLDLGHMRAVTECLTVPELITRLRDAFDSGRLRCGEIEVDTSQTFKQWSFRRYSSFKEHSRWPCVVAEGWRSESVDGWVGPFAAIDEGRYFRDGFEVIGHVTTFPVFHGAIDARKWTMSVVIEDRRARIARVERHGEVLGLEIDGDALDSLVISGQIRDGSGGHDDFRLDVAPRLHHPLPKGPVDVDLAIFDRRSQRLDQGVQHVDAAPILQSDPTPKPVGEEVDMESSAVAEIGEADPPGTQQAPTRVFISYSHDGSRHRQSIVDLAARLRNDGIDAWLDQYSPSPPQGWPRWMLDQIDAASFVLLVCTPTYKRRFEGREAKGDGKGSTWEGMLATQLLYEANARNDKLIPVLMGDGLEENVPRVLRPFTRYRLPDEYEELYSHLTGRSGVTVPPLKVRKNTPGDGKGPALPARPVLSKGMPESTRKSLLLRFVALLLPWQHGDRTLVMVLAGPAVVVVSLGIVWYVLESRSSSTRAFETRGGRESKVPELEPRDAEGGSGSLGMQETTCDGCTDDSAAVSPSCHDGIQNQSEVGRDCGGPCHPCKALVCSNGERRRCWVECVQEYPKECMHAGVPPLVMGIETCHGGQWGACETQSRCEDLADPCMNGEEFAASFECVDGSTRHGLYTCIRPVGVTCTESYYANWPAHDCPEDLCMGPPDGCSLEGDMRACEVHCDAPSGVTRAGSQSCRSYCGDNLAWGPCQTKDACLGT